MIRTLFSSLALRLYPAQVQSLANEISAWKTIKYEEESKRLEIVIHMLISGEDHRFRFHPGFDLIAIIRALKQKIVYNKTEGASTIDQQLVRVLTKDYRRCFSRKIKEIFLATTLTRFIKREHIPILYLHTAYYGTELVGIQQVLLKKDILSPISLTSAAEIVARIKYPEPKEYSARNMYKIDIRTQYLLNLYSIHSSHPYFIYHKL